MDNYLRAAGATRRPAIPRCGPQAAAQNSRAAVSPPPRPGNAPIARRSPIIASIVAIAQCSQVVQSMLAYAADVMHLLAYGCYKYSPYHGWQTVKPCPAHVLCGRMPNIFDEERAVRGRGPWRPRRTGAHVLTLPPPRPGPLPDRLPLPLPPRAGAGPCLGKEPPPQVLGRRSGSGTGAGRRGAEGGRHERHGVPPPCNRPRVRRRRGEEAGRRGPGQDDERAALRAVGRGVGAPSPAALLLFWPRPALSRSPPSGQLWDRGRGTWWTWWSCAGHAGPMPCIAAVSAQWRGLFGPEGRGRQQRSTKGDGATPHLRSPPLPRVTPRGQSRPPGPATWPLQAFRRASAAFSLDVGAGRAVRRGRSAAFQRAPGRLLFAQPRTRRSEACLYFRHRAARALGVG